MAVFDQPKTVYSDNTAQARAISDVISMIDPRDTPLIARLGLDSAREKFKLSLDGYKIELLEDELDPLDDAVNDGAGWDNSSTTGLAVDDASKFQDGHILLVEDEKMVVKDVDTANNTIDVYGRGFGGTNPATHADDTVIYIVGMARLEGDDYSSTALSGSSSASGSVVTCETVTAQSGDGGNVYVMLVSASVDGNMEIRKFLIRIVAPGDES